MLNGYALPIICAPVVRIVGGDDRGGEGWTDAGEVAAPSSVRKKDNLTMLLLIEVSAYSALG